MSRFEDETTQQIYLTRFASGVPQHVSVAAHEALRLLVAATSFQDVGVLGPVCRWRSLPGRYGVVIDDKWHVTFGWDETFGASALKLERRRPQK